MNGTDYHFFAVDEFNRRLKAGEFIETARVHDHLYGTLRAPVAEALEAGRDVLLNIDTQGSRSVKALFPDCTRVFILPPSWKVLEDRLTTRGQDGDDVIARRLANAREEVTRLPEYDYAIVNDRLDEAVADLRAIVRAEKRRLSRLAGELKRLSFLH